MESLNHLSVAPYISEKIYHFHSSPFYSTFFKVPSTLSFVQNVQSFDQKPKIFHLMRKRNSISYTRYTKYSIVDYIDVAVGHLLGQSIQYSVHTKVRFILSPRFSQTYLVSNGRLGFHMHLVC